MQFLSVESATGTFAVNVDIDLDQCLPTVNTQCTYKVQGGTDVMIKIPMDLQVIAPVGSTIAVCKEQTIKYSTNTIVTNNLSNCIYNEYIGYAAITFKVGQTYTGIDQYYFYVGNIKNPSSARYPDSFEVIFSNGDPIGSVSQGLILTYIPNLIYSASLTYSNVQAGTTDTYVFKFKITNNILQRGYLRLTFPSPWTSAPQNIQSITSINVYGSNRSGFQVMTPITSDATYSDLFNLNDLTADASKFITITLTGVTNPNSITTTGSFEITTLDDALNPIDQVATGLTVSITQPGTLTVDSAIIGDKTVDSQTFIQFTISPSVKYGSGGYIEIVIPDPQMSYSTVISCSGFVGTVGSSTCTRVNSYTIRFFKSLSSSLLVSLSSLQMSVSFFRNALGVMTIPSFKIYFKESDGSIVAQNLQALTYTTVASTCTVTSAVRSTTVLTVGQTGAQYTLTFTCATRLPSVGRLSFVFPDEQVSFNSGMTCQDGSSNTIACTNTQGSGIFTVVVQASVYCPSTECSSSQVYVLKLINAKNPSYINSPLTQSVQIKTENLINGTYYTISSLTSGVYFTNDLVPGTLTNVALTRTGSVLTGGVPIYTFTFQTATVLANGAVIQLTFPTATAYLDSSLTVTCRIGSTSKTCSTTALASDSTQLSRVLISSACTSTTCATPFTFSVQVTNFINPFSTVANTDVAFTIQTRLSSTNGLVDQIIYNAPQLSLTPNSLTVALTAPATPIIVGDLTSYTITITNPINRLPSSTNQGSLVITFPSQITLQTNQCTAQTSTSTLTCVANPTTQKVTITSSSDQPKSTTITVQFVNNVKNPPTGTTSDPFLIETLYSTGKIDQSTGLTVKPDTFNEILNPSSTRDVVTVDSAVKLTLSFQTTNPIPANAQIKFYIPTDQGLIDSSSTFAATDKSGSGSISVLSSLAGPSGGFNIFTLQEWCSNDNGGSSCPNTFTSKVEITGFKNPANARFPTNSIKIEIYTSTGDKIDAVTANFFTIPQLNYGALQSVLVARTNNVVGQTTTYTFTFQTASNGDLSSGAGFVNIFFPVGFLYDLGTTVSCSVRDINSGPSSITTTCTATRIAEAMGNYVSKIVGNLQCGTINCVGGATFEFKITGYYNPFSTKPRDGQIISTSTSSGSGSSAEIKNVLDQIIGTDISKTQLPDFTTGTIIANSVIRTVLNVDTATNIQFSLTLPTRLEKGGYIQVSVPNTQFLPNGENYQYQQGSGTTAWGTSQSLSVYSSTSDFTIFQLKEWCSGTNFCISNTILRFQIVRGFKNVGYVATPTNFFTITTYTKDNTYQIDSVSNVQATPDVQPAAITVNSITFDKPNAAVSSVTIDISVKFGATINPTNYVLLTFDSEFIRKDGGALTCAIVSGSTETTKTCSTTDTSNAINTIQIDNICSTACDSTSTYVLRIKNAVNRFYVDTFSGNLLIETRIDASTLISTKTYALSSVSTLSPGELTSTTVVRSKSTQGIAADFTLNWTIPGYLLDGSLVELRLPLNQIVISTGSSYTFTDGGSTSLTWTAASGSPTTTHNIFETTEWKCISANCNSGITFTVKISNSKNPYSQSTDYDDFVIIHKRSDGKLIFQSPSPLDATPDLAFGVIDNITVTHQNYPYVLRTTEYVFAFTVQSDIPQGGKIRLTFPPNRVLESTTTNMTCKISSTTYPCTPTFTSSTGILQVIMTDICPSAACTSPLTYSVTLSGRMKNPASVPTITGNFIVETLSSGNFIVSQGKMDNSKTTQILPEPLTVQVNRSSPYMSAQNDYRVYFETVNPIPAGGFIRVIFPTEQVKLPTNGPTCKIDFVLTSLSCREVFKPSGYVWVDIQIPCSTGCAAYYNFQLLFQQLTNPASFLANQGTSTFAVYTMNANKEYIDGLDTGLKAYPDLIGKTAIIKAVELENTTVGTNTDINFLVVPGSDFTAEAIFDFYFPDQFAFSRGSNTCYVVISKQRGMTCTFTNYASGYIKKVSLSSPCPFDCQETGTYQYIIPIKNRGDNYYADGQFMVIERYAEIDVGQGIINNAIEFDPGFIWRYYVGSEGSNVIEADAKLYVSVTPVNIVPTLSNGGRIRFILPSQVTINSNICQAKLDGNPSSGLKCTISGQTVTITHAAQQITNQNLTVEIQKIINPSTTRPSDPILVYTEVNSQKTGTYYIIDQNLVNLTYQVTGLTELLDVSITRQPMTDSIGYETGQPTQLQYNIQLNHALESTSSFIVQLPQTAQVMMITGSSSATCYSTDKQGKVQNLLLCEIITSNRTIIIRNYCQVAACNRKSRIYFKMYEDFIQNYHYVVNPLNITRDSMLVRTTTKEGYFYIDESKTNVMIKPDLVPTYLILPSPEIIRTNNVISRRVKWVMSFKTNKNPVPQGGYLVIKIPQNVLLTIKNSTVDLLNYDTSGLYDNYTQYTYDDGLSIKNITIWNFCNSSKGCPIGGAYSLMIDWIKNPLSQLGNIDSAITIETMTPEGYAAERGTTPPVYKLFSELIPVSIANLLIRPLKPVPNVVTTYEISFTADAEFSVTDILVIQFPPEINPWPKVTASRNLQSSLKCKSIFAPQSQINCTQKGNLTIVVRGLFVNNFKQYGVQISNVQNPSVSGPTSGFLIEVQNSQELTIASRTTNSRIDVLDSIQDQNTCNKVCGSCAGTSATCTSCNVPSKYPLFRNFACVDTCGQGYFFDQPSMQCFKCYQGCNECNGPGINQCYSCSEGYFKEDGSCVSYCSKGMIEKDRECVQPNNSVCDSNCETCSYNKSQCLSCKQNWEYSVLDVPTGRCIKDDSKLCNNSFSDRFYIDQVTKECRICNELCKTCERSNNLCTSCWNFQANNIVNELYETCVDVCGLGTWYNKETEKCSYCNSVCLLCNGYESDQCTVCNKTPEAKQLYLKDSECLLQCPQRYFVNEAINECQEGQAQILSFSFLFMIFSVIAGATLVGISMYKTRNSNKTLDVIYAVSSGVEALNRFFLLGNLWIKTNAFALAVGFMNLIATCAIAVFFNFLFMSPIYAHSPHFRQLYKKFSTPYQIVTCVSYFSGVNMMRLLTSNFLALESMRSDLNNWKFYLVPLNTMANFTVIFTGCQVALNIYVLMVLTIADDAFVLAILGMLLNVGMVTLQFFKHLSTRTFMIRSS